VEALILAQASTMPTPVAFLGSSLDIFLAMRNRKHLPERPKTQQE
jgi:hypothetical protein